MGGNGWQWVAIFGHRVAMGGNVVELQNLVELRVPYEGFFVTGAPR